MLGAGTFPARESVGIRQVGSVCGRQPEGLGSDSGSHDGWAPVPGGQALRGLGEVRQGPADLSLPSVPAERDFAPHPLLESIALPLARRMDAGVRPQARRGKTSRREGTGLCGQERPTQEAEPFIKEIGRLLSTVAVGSLANDPASPLAPQR